MKFKILSIVLISSSFILNVDDFQNRSFSFYEKALGQVSASEIIGVSENVYPKELSLVHFKSGNGVLISYTNSKKIVGSILFEPNGEDYCIAAIYKGNSIPFTLDSNYCLSPFDFVTKEEFSTSKLQNPLDSPTIYNNTSAIKDSGRARYNQQSTSDFFSVDLSTHLYMYSAYYLSETRILNVPNYMNTMFNHNGCVPTTAAMYFSFLDRECPGENNLIDGTLPLHHTENISAVNSFISLLGNDYFYTTTRGTYNNKIAPGFSNYLKSKGLDSYNAYNFTDFSDYVSIIRDTANPIPITLNINHEVLGIGYKILPTNTGATNYAIANYVYNDSMEEVTFPISNVSFYTEIHS